MSLAKFTEAVKRIRDKCDFVLKLTSPGDLNATGETQQEHLLKLRPEMVSYDCESINWQHNSLLLYVALVELILAAVCCSFLNETAPIKLSKSNSF